jgi:hypothetical protein
MHRLWVALLVALALIAGGCGGSSSPSPTDPVVDPDPTNPPDDGGDGTGGDDPGDPVGNEPFVPPLPPAAGQLAGRVQKGLLLYAEVSAFRRLDGGWVQVDTTLSDENGDFLLDIGEGEGPVRLQARLISGSRMICDFLANNCNLYFLADFGSPVSLPFPLSLEAVVPGNRSGEFVVISPLTHIAAAWAASMPGEPTDQKAMLALNRVADLFGLSADFVWHYPIDITRVEQIDWASESSLRHAWLSTAIGQDMLNNGLQNNIMPADYFAALATSFVAAFGQLSGPTASQLALLLQEVSDTITSKLGIDTASLPVASLIAQLDAYGSAETQLPLAMVPGNDDSARGVFFLEMINEYLSAAGINADADILARWADYSAWIGVEGEDWYGIAVLVDAVAQAVALGLAHDAIAYQPGCVAMEQYADPIIATGITDVVPLSLFDGERPDHYVSVCHDGTETELVFSTINGTYLGQQIALRLRLQESSVSNGERLIAFVVPEDASVDDVSASGWLGGGAAFHLRVPDQTGSAQGLAGWFDFISSGEVSPLNLADFRALTGSLEVALSYQLASASGSGQAYALDLTAAAQMDAPAYLAGNQPLLAVSMEELSVSVSGEGGTPRFRFALRDVPGALPLLYPGTLELARPLSVNGSIRLMLEGLPTLDWNLQGSSDWLTGQVVRLLDVVDGEGTLTSRAGEFDYRGTAELLAHDVGRDFPRFALTTAGGTRTVTDVNTGTTALVASLENSRGGYLMAGDTVLAVLRAFYAANGSGGADVYPLGEPVRVYRWADPVSPEPPAPPDEGGAEPQ